MIVATRGALEKLATDDSDADCCSITLKFGYTGEFDDDLEEDEVLALNLPKSRRKYDEESDEDDDNHLDAAPAKPAKVKKDRLSNRQKDLLPLESKTRTSRLDRPTASTSKVSLDEDEDAEQSLNEDEDDDDDDDEADTKDDDAEDEFDDEWARTGGYHVTKREIARMEEQASAPGGRFSADEQAEQRDALELYEARRIQKEAKDKLDETDYIDDEELEDTDNKVEDLLALTRVDRSQRVPQALKFDSREEAIAHLLNREPELLALLDDFSACSERLPIVQQTVKQLRTEEQDGEKKVALALLYQGKLVAVRRTTLTVTDYLHYRYLHDLPHPSCILLAYQKPSFVPSCWFSTSRHGLKPSCQDSFIDFNNGRLRYHRPARPGEAQGSIRR